jgi:hypothetical protein
MVDYGGLCRRRHRHGLNKGEKIYTSLVTKAGALPLLIFLILDTVLLLSYGYLALIFCSCILWTFGRCQSNNKKNLGLGTYSSPQNIMSISPFAATYLFHCLKWPFRPMYCFCRQIIVFPQTSKEEYMRIQLKLRFDRWMKRKLFKLLPILSGSSLCFRYLLNSENGFTLWN